MGSPLIGTRMRAQIFNLSLFIKASTLPIHLFGILPKMVKTVKLAGSFFKNMDHDTAYVDQNPNAFTKTFFTTYS